MKTQFIKYFSLYMAVQVLVASMGIAYTEHFCLVKGREITVFSDNHPHNCCSKTTKTTEQGIKRKSCCEDQQFFKKISTDASNGHSVKTKLAPPSAPAFIVFSQNYCYQNLSFTHTAIALPIGHAPPLSGHERCILFATFLI